MVKDLLLHLTLKIVDQDSDGIVPLSDVDDEPDLLTRLEAEFERIWGDHATDRLAEVDQLLGSQTADEEAPEPRSWLVEDLFDYHVSKFDRTPILWRSITTSRLVSDPEGEGFACLVDYHQLDAGVFDRLQNRYLEPRKALLRERRSDGPTAAGATTRCRPARRQLPLRHTTAVKADSNRSVSSRTDSPSWPNPHLVSGQLKSNRLHRTPSNL